MNSHGIISHPSNVVMSPFSAQTPFFLFGTFSAIAGGERSSYVGREIGLEKKMKKQYRQEIPKANPESDKRE
jgi:hypothetical protein